jgi:hypothetical protein
MTEQNLEVTYSVLLPLCLLMLSFLLSSLEIMASWPEVSFLVPASIRKEHYSLIIWGRAIATMPVELIQEVSGWCQRSGT